MPLTGTDKRLPQTTADQLVVSGVLAKGAVASIHYRGGRSRGTISGGNTKQDFGPLPVPERYTPAPGVPEGPAFNVAQAYAQLAEDPASVPSFEDAVVRHRMIEAIRTAARTGQRQRL